MLLQFCSDSLAVAGLLVLRLLVLVPPTVASSCSDIFDVGGAERVAHRWPLSLLRQGDSQIAKNVREAVPTAPARRLLQKQVALCNCTRSSCSYVL